MLQIRLKEDSTYYGIGPMLNRRRKLSFSSFSSFLLHFKPRSHTVFANRLQKKEQGQSGRPFESSILRSITKAKSVHTGMLRRDAACLELKSFSTFQIKQEVETEIRVPPTPRQARSAVGRRTQKDSNSCDLRMTKAFKALSVGKRHKTAGRNASGSITMFHRGGGAKRLQRRIDFRRNSFIDHIGLIERIEYDPNRSSQIALVRWVVSDNASPSAVKEAQYRAVPREKEAFTYIIASANLKVGDKIKNFPSNNAARTSMSEANMHSVSTKKRLPIFSQSGARFDFDRPDASRFVQKDDTTLTTERSKAFLSLEKGIQQAPETAALERPSVQVYDVSSHTRSPGNCMPLSQIPIGTLLHNIEWHPGQGAKLVRAAGTFARLVQKFDDTNQSILRLPSGITKQLDSRCRATLGTVSNSAHNTINLTKAGQSRWLGRRPTVRGVAMNPIDHPHGGGEGRTSGGRPSVSPWGKPSKGGFKTAARTRKKK